jgi:hypothetical protein
MTRISDGCDTVNRQRIYYTGQDCVLFGNRRLLYDEPPIMWDND